MRTVVLLVVASLAWSSGALADPEALPPSLPPLPDATRQPAPAPPPSAPPDDAAPAEPTPPTPAVQPPQPYPAPEPLPVQPLMHRGFYLRATSGFGALSVSGSAPGGGSASVSGFATTGGIAIGGSPEPGFAIGFMLDAGTATGTFKGGPQVVATTTYPGPLGSATETLSGNAQGTSALIGGFVDWFPNPRAGWHVGASIGVGVSGIKDDANHQMASIGLGLGASGGYDWWIARSLSAGIHVFILGAFQGQANDNQGNDTGYRLGSTVVGLGGQVLYY